MTFDFSPVQSVSMVTGLLTVWSSLPEGQGDDQIISRFVSRGVAFTLESQFFIVF